MNCAEFLEHADWFAVGLVEMETRTRLIEHASGCASCSAHLRSLTTIADQLLTLAPEVEPPPGFEGRVLDHLASVVDQPHRVRSRPSRWLVAAATAAALLVGGASFAVGRGGSRSVAVVRSGTIVRSDGSTSGRISLFRRPRPMVVLTIDAPRPFSGVVTCHLVLVDGRNTAVGSWTYDQVASGVWAVGIDDSLLGATSMQITEAGGRVLATASLVTN